MRAYRPRLRARGLALLLAVLALPACGVTAPRGSDGFADLDSLGALDVDNTLTLSIGPSVLRFAARHVGDDPETKALLEGLDGVRVRVYEIDGDAARVARRMDRMGRRLQSDGWSPLALVREADGAHTQLLMKTQRDRVTGLTVISSDGAEAVIVNVMGELRPELFSDAMAALSVDAAPEVRLESGSGKAPPG